MFRANRITVLKMSSTKSQNLLKVTVTKYAAFSQSMWDGINAPISFK